MASGIGYSVPEGSFGFWTDRFARFDVTHSKPAEKFGEPFLSFLDPDGLRLELVVAGTKDSRTPWETPDVTAAEATRGFHQITLTLADIKGTMDVLTSLLGYVIVGQEGNRYRFATPAVGHAAIVDLVEVPGGRPGQIAGGAVHHVAFRVKDRAVQQKIGERIVAAGLEVTERIDRNYFYSVYFREPGGVLFEIATDEPGFTVDEPVGDLGSHLRLPAQYEMHRSEIEGQLPLLE